MGNRGKNPKNACKLHLLSCRECKQYNEIKSFLLYYRRDENNIMKKVQLCIEKIRAMRGGDESNASNIKKNHSIVRCKRSESNAQSHKVLSRIVEEMKTMRGYG